MTRKKKLLLILWALCIVTLLCACGEDPSATLDPNYNAAANEVSPEIEKGKADAASLSNDCNMVFSGVKNGRINHETKDSKGNAVTWAPQSSANDTEKLKAAENITIAQVIEYTDTDYDVSVMVYVTNEFSDNYKGKILYLNDPKNEKNKNKVAPLKRDITLGKLYA